MVKKDWAMANSVEELESYDTITKYLQSKRCETRKKHLLLGNGFSVAYDPEIFSYTALSDFVKKSKNKLLVALFQATGTENFEEVMSHLGIFLIFAKTFKADTSLIEDIATARDSLQKYLIQAVETMHPKHVFTIPEERSRMCAEFLNYYLANEGNIFSSNYDLLLYWVLMRNLALFPNAGDGFGRECLNPPTGEFMPDWEPEFSDDLRWGFGKLPQNIFYLHGALPLFDTGIDVIKEEYDGELLINKIQGRMTKNEYPIFVTAGDGTEKLTHIMHNKYLQSCYETLSSITGTLVTYGFSFGVNDTHIIKAINKAAAQGKGKNLCSLYIGVYSDEDLAHIKVIRNQFKIPLRVYNAKTVRAW